MVEETIQILLKYKLQVGVQYNYSPLLDPPRTEVHTTPFTFIRGYNTVPTAIWEQIKLFNSEKWSYYDQYLKEPVTE